MFSGRRGRLVLASTLVVLSGLALVLVLWKRRDGTSTWERYLAGLDTFEVIPSSHRSIDYQRQRVHLRNNIQRRPFWGRDDARELVGIISLAPLDSLAVDDDTDPRLAETKYISSSALLAVAMRIQVGGPIAPEALTILVDTLLDRTYAADPFVRHGLANGLCASGLILSDKRVHDRVVEMIDDPDPEVAMNARRHYTWHTATDEAREKLRTIGATPWEASTTRRGGGG